MGVGVRYPEASTAWRTFSLRPSLLNVILFPKTGCDRTGTRTGTVWIAALWADLRLGLAYQSGFTGVTARTNMAAETLDAWIPRFSTEQLKDAANDSGDALLPTAYFVSTQ
jgi:hypothetical protein